MKLLKFLLPIFTILLFISCKKGAEDPAVSLLSRKARFVGEWKVASYVSETVKIETTSYGGIPYSATTNSSIVSDGSRTTETISHPGGSGGDELSYDETTTYSIKSNGTWKSETNILKILNDTIYEGYGPNEMQYKLRTETIQKTENAGNWNFLAGIGEAKNKEIVVLSKTLSKETKDVSTTRLLLNSSAPATTTNTNIVINNSYIDAHAYWKLIRLANKEIKININYYYSKESITNGSANGISSEKTSSDMVLQQVKK